MGFLSPLLLALAAALAIPVVLHLFQRHQGPRMVFPALRYLRRAEKESARRIKLRQLLLLALRVAAIVLVAFAAARPFVRAGGIGHEPTAAAIVLDNSLSTGLVVGDRRVLDDLKQRALELVAQAAPDDRFWVIRAGSPGDPAVPGDAAAAAERIRTTELSSGAADLDAALARARSLVAAGAEKRAPEIDLVSDLQATGFPRPLPAGGGAPPLVAWVPDRDVPPNAGIAEVEVGGGLAPRAGERSTVDARIVGSRTDSVGLRLTLDGRTSAAAHAAVGATAILPFPAHAPGLATGWVELDPDALRGDDRRYFVVSVQPPPVVALTQPVPFADAALGVLADAGRITRGDVAAADVVLAPGGAAAAGAPPGKTMVVVAPESPLERPATNQRLGAAGVPWRFAAPQLAGEARFDVRDSTDELTRALAGVRIRQLYPLQRQGRAAGDTVLLALSDGSPWAVRGTLPSGGRFILIASPLSSEATTLPTSPAMVPLLDHVSGIWASSAPARSEVAPGDAVALPPGATAVERPDGVRDRVDDGSYRAPDRAGIYRILAGEKPAGAFAVNPPAGESDLTRLSGRRLEALLPDWDVTTPDSPRQWSRAVFRQRLGHEVWRPLLLLLLSILLIEGLVATAGRARPRSEGESGRGGEGATGWAGWRAALTRRVGKRGAAGRGLHSPTPPLSGAEGRGAAGGAVPRSPAHGADGGGAVPRSAGRRQGVGPGLAPDGGPEVG